MPRPKVTFKDTVLELEVRDLEITVGPEVIKAGHLKASLDVADLLRAPLVHANSGLRLLNHGEKKIACIKEIRGHTGLGLKEAKLASENTPWVWEGQDAGEFGKKLEAIGATVELIEGAGRPVTVLDRLREILAEALDAS